MGQTVYDQSDFQRPANEQISLDVVYVSSVDSVALFATLDRCFVLRAIRPTYVYNSILRPQVVQYFVLEVRNPSNRYFAPAPFNSVLSYFDARVFYTKAMSLTLFTTDPKSICTLYYEKLPLTYRSDFNENLCAYEASFFYRQKVFSREQN